MTMCSTCKRRQVHAMGECKRCYTFRGRTGKKRPNDTARLSIDDLVEIAIDYVKFNAPLKLLAMRYGVHPSTIRLALRGKTKRYAGLFDRLPPQYVEALKVHREKSKSRKLTNRQAFQIRIEHAAGRTQGWLAMSYPVSWTAIGYIVHGITYKEAGGPIAAVKEQYTRKEVI